MDGSPPEPTPAPPYGAGPPALVAALAAHLSEGLLLVRDGEVTASVTPPGGLIGHGDRVGTHTLDHTHPDDLAAALDVAARVLGGEPGTQASLTVRLRRPDGSWGRYGVDAINCTDDPVLGGLVVRTRTLYDDEPALAEVDTDGLLRMLVDAMPSGVLLLERYGRVLHANASAVELLGTDLAGLRARRLESVVPVEGEDQAALAVALDEVCEGRGERDLRVSAGIAGERRLRIRLTTGDASRVGAVLALVDDVTEEEAREADLRHLATYDPLTGLLNGRILRDLVADLVVARHAPDTPVGSAQPFVVFCDIDGFKGVNDRHGHLRGDEVLVSVSHRLRDAVGERGAVGRLGGDELVVACPRIDDADAAALLDRIGAVRVEGLDPDEPPVTVSVGWSRVEPGDDADAVLGRADAAMYRRKRRRRAGQG